MPSTHDLNRDDAGSSAVQHWLVEPPRRRIFAYAAAAAMLLCIFAFDANLMTQNDIELIQQSVPLKIIGVLIASVTIPLALWLWIGMCWYWLRLDASPRRPKTLYFLTLLLFNWVGAILYYFTVYRRHWRGPREADSVLRSFPLLLSCLFFGAIPFLYLYPRFATNRFVELTLFIVGLLVVVPTTVSLLVRMRHYG
jgi:hypothetical protein